MAPTEVYALNPHLSRRSLARRRVTALLVRTRCPAADTERSQHDFHRQRAKDESHYTDEDGRALPTDHPQNRIRKKQQDVGEVESQKAEIYVGACVLS